MNKINKYGQVPIYLRVTKNRRSKYIALDVYIDPKDWNEKTGKVRPGAIMGHASVKHTEVYAKILNEELDKAMEVFNKPH